MTDDILQRWKELCPDPARPPFLVGESEDRRTLIGGLRALADFLESRPEMPAPRYSLPVYVFTRGNQEQRLAQLDYAATLAGVPRSGSGGRYEVTINFGSLAYSVLSNPSEEERRSGDARSFNRGDEVRLTGSRRDQVVGEQSLTGIVTGQRDAGAGRMEYLVRFPGLPDLQAVPAADLEPAPPLDTVLTSSGPVTTLAAAENALIAAGARSYARLAAGRETNRAVNRDFRVLAEAVSRICELPADVLLGQLRPQIDMRVRMYQQSPARLPAEPAASDQTAAPRRARGSHPAREQGPSR
jgi:hypothetical protein